MSLRSSFLFFLFGMAFFIYLVPLKDNFPSLDSPQKLPLICDWGVAETMGDALNVKFLHFHFKSPFKQKN